MHVSDLMQADLETVSPETSINDVFVTLAETRVSALPVVDGAGRLIGVISRTDIVASEEDAEGEAARAALFETTLVRDLMTSPALTIAADASIRDSARQMLSTGVHRLFVVSDQHAIGVISVTDILAAVADGRL
jgi:CBS domain-containing protein